MNKKPFILALCGSPRKQGNTAKFLKIILNSAQKEGAKTRLIYLVDKNIKPCLGCYSTNPKNCTFPCVQKDDMEDIYKFLISADGIVVGSPSYWHSVSGLMKNFFDRLCSLENNGFLLKGKLGASVVSSEESGGEEVSNWQVGILNTMGCFIPPFAAAYFNTKGQESWRLEDLDNLGKNIVRLCKLIKKRKFNYPQK